MDLSPEGTGHAFFYHPARAINEWRILIIRTKNVYTILAHFSISD